MRVITKALRYWKTEHHDLDNCQDAYDLDTSRGLFVVADGAGTTLFPALWARILAQHFVHIPLMSKDPFEIEWWVRQAQDEYKRRIPNNLHDWSIRQKALNQSSDSTLATLRITDSLPNEAHGELLVFGDSCVIIGNKQDKNVASFVLQQPAEFAQPPICLPSTLRFFNRSFHTCSIRSVTLRPEHLVIIASDAVAKWILSAGDGHYAGPWEAFGAVYASSQESWPGFIDMCREAREMVNDDSTAVILTLLGDDSVEGESLGTTTDHDAATVEARKAAFEQARQEQNSEMVAIYFGDGVDLQSRVSISSEEVEHARKVADALKEVLRHFRQAQNQPNLAARMQPIWKQYGPLLEHEKCAENIRETLKNNGVNLSLAPVPPTQPHPSLPLMTPGAPPPPREIESPAPHGTLTNALPPREIESSAPHGTSPQEKLLQQEKQAEKGKQEMLEAERNFLKMYTDYIDLDEEVKKERYDMLLSAADALKNIYASYNQIYPFTPAQQKQLTLAQSYKQATDYMRKALRDGYAETLVDAYQPELIGSHLLTPEQLRGIELARQFLAALQVGDDRAILTTHDEMSSPHATLTFQFTEQELVHVRRASERMQYLEQFRHAVSSGRLQQIAVRYDPMLDTSKEVTASERELLALAQEFVAASQEDDATLVAVVEKIKRSGHFNDLAFTNDETSRIEQARQNVEKRQNFLSLTVAKVRGVSINVDQVRYVCLIRTVFCEDLIRRFQLDLQDGLSQGERQEKERLIRNYQDYITRDHLIGNALDELVNDVFIKEKMEERPVQDTFIRIYNGNEKIRELLEYFQQQVSPDYSTFCKKNHLSDAAVQKTIRMIARFNFYKKYYEQNEVTSNFVLGPFKKPSTLEEWLERQHRDVIYTQKSTAEQTARWLTEQLDWQAS